MYGYNRICLLKIYIDLIFHILRGKKWYPSAADIPNIQYVDRVSHFNMPVMTG